MLNLEYTNQFKKDIKKISKQGLDIEKLHKVIDILQKQEKLPAQYRDHLLVNSRNYKNMRECHIEADWLLIYKIYDDAMVLVAVRTGSHSEMSIITSLVFSMPFLARVPTLARVSSTSLPTMPSPGW